MLAANGPLYRRNTTGRESLIQPSPTYIRRLIKLAAEEMLAATLLLTHVRARVHLGLEAGKLEQRFAAITDLIQDVAAPWSPERSKGQQNLVGMFPTTR